MVLGNESCAWLLPQAGPSFTEQPVLSPYSTHNLLCIYPHPFSFCTCIQWFVQVLWHQTDCGVECVQAPLTRSRASKERNKVMDSPEQLQDINGSPLERQKKKQSLGQRRSLGARRQSMVIEHIWPVPVFLLFPSWATHPVSAILILTL